MPIRFRLASAEEFQKASEQGISPSAVTQLRLRVGESLRKSGELDKETKNFFEIFFELLVSIDQKVDLLTEAVAAKSTPEGRGTQLCDVEISGGGISFLVPQGRLNGKEAALKIDDLLFLELSIPQTPPNVVSCYTKVRRVTPKGNQTEIAVEYEIIHNDDREEVIRFVHHQERIMLQARRGSPR